MSKWHRNHIPSLSVVHSSTPLCYIQNATLLTFMPPFILIYMYMFELILISQLHPYEKYREKGKTLTGYLNNSWRKEKCNRRKKKEKKKRTPVLEVWKNISIKNLFYRRGIPWAESPFWSDAEQYHNFFLFFCLFFYGKYEKIWIYLHYTHFT